MEEYLEEQPEESRRTQSLVAGRVLRIEGFADDSAGLPTTTSAPGCAASNLSCPVSVFVALFRRRGIRGAASSLSPTGIEQGGPLRCSSASPGRARPSPSRTSIERLQRPTLIISHNKTLAAQLFDEFKEFFPDNAVEYFVSYYDYYQPEAYLPQTDTYIEKDSAINDDIDKLRHSATRSLLRAPGRAHRGQRVVHLRPRRAGVLRQAARAARGRGGARPAAAAARLVDIQYQRNDLDFHAARSRPRQQATT